MAAVSSPGVLLAFLGLLTWLGTLEQTQTGLYEVQKKYFESLILVHHVGSVPVPLRTLVHFFPDDIAAHLAPAQQEASL